MEIQILKKYKLPDAPGVYFFRDAHKKVLYIGKATSLKSRVRSYFIGDISKTRSELIANMVEKAKSIDFIKTDSVLEALILEANLIKKYKPRYNSKEKDNKSFNYILITKEDFPRVLIVRGREIDSKFKKEEIKYLFGPFPQGGLLKDTLKIIRKIFPFFDTKYSISNKTQKSKLNFNRQIGLYPDANVTKKEYANTIRNIKLFLDGKKGVLIKKLDQEMKEFAKVREFEKADEIKRKIFALKHIQDVSLIRAEFKKIYIDKENFRIEAYDIAHFGGEAVVGVMTVIEDGEINKNEYRKFNIRHKDSINDPAHLAEIISRRLEHTEWEFPKIIVVDGGKIQKNAAEKVLKESGVDIPVVSVVKDKHHRAKDILGKKYIVKKYEKDILLANHESHRFAISYHRGKLRTVRRK